MKVRRRVGILVYTRQPFVAIGLAAVLRRSDRLRLVGCCDNLSETIRQLRAAKPDILLIHLTQGPSLAELAHLHSLQTGCPIVLWGDDPGGDFVFQAMDLGVRAFLPNETPAAKLLTSILSAHAGVLCFEKSFVEKVMVQRRITLTRRQGELLWLVAQGFKNKAIGAKLGITEGTVKVYIYKLFKKLGVTGRLEMALCGLQYLYGSQQTLALMQPDIRETRVPRPFVPQSVPARARDGVGQLLVQ